MIKQLTRSDLSVAAEVVRISFATVAEAFGLTEQNCPRHPAFAVTEERLQGFFGKSCRMYGLFEDGKMVGYTALSDQGDGVYGIHNLAVLPGYRHKGYGKRLLDVCKRQVMASNGVNIKIEIIEDNTMLKDWYLANGFRALGTERIEQLPFLVGFLAWECNELNEQRR
ncbi:MAG: GNAT family N-acetyltransferase [Oscillospiraceae bacterium]|nr:GNAT family N-acetyltransferase [Oscillospiraceae bacterium]